MRRIVPTQALLGLRPWIHRAPEVIVTAHCSIQNLTRFASRIRNTCRRRFRLCALTTEVSVSGYCSGKLLLQNEFALGMTVPAFDLCCFDDNEAGVERVDAGARR
jgi:hypothetical protein